MELSSGSSSSLVTQGTIDWTQIARATIEFQVSFISRLAAADVSQLTLLTGQVIFSEFRLSTIGRKRLQTALDGLQSFSSLGNVVWFGFGIKHLVRVLSETDQGVTILTICGCLAEVMTTRACASICLELAKEFGAPAELRPSAQQWCNLVEVCSGILRSTTFSSIAEQFMSFSRSRPLAAAFDEFGSFDEPQSIAKALRTLSRISSGDLASVTLTGGSSCGWIAAIGFYFLGLHVEIQGLDGNTLYASTDAADSIQILVCYGDPNSRLGTEISKVTYHIKTINQIFRSGEKKYDFIMSGTVPWDNCLQYTFGPATIQALLRPEVEFSTILRLAGEVFQGLSRAEESNIFRRDFHQLWIGYQPSQQGYQFLRSVLAWFPELASLETTPTNLSVLGATIDESAKKYKTAMGKLADLCHCVQCESAIGLVVNEFCLPALAETIICLAWNLSSIRFAQTLQPYRVGLYFLYHLRAGSADIGGRFGVRYTEASYRYRNRNYGMEGLVAHMDMASVYHTCQFLFTVQLSPQSVGSFSAISVGGLCFYLPVLQGVSDCPEAVALLHVVPGDIQGSEGRRYEQILDKTGEGWDGMFSYSWEDEGGLEMTADFTKTYQSKVPRPLQAINDELTIGTGNADIETSLIVEESIEGLKVDILFVSSEGRCEVGPYSLTEEIILAAGVVHCTHNNCPQLDPLPDDMVILDGEGDLRTDTFEDNIVLRRLSGNRLARCMGLLIHRDPLYSTVILRQNQCISCCIAATDETGIRPSFIIL